MRLPLGLLLLSPALPALFVRALQRISMPSYDEQIPLLYQTAAAAVSDKELLLQGPRGQDQPPEGHGYTMTMLQLEAGQRLTAFP